MKDTSQKRLALVQGEPSLKHLMLPHTDYCIHLGAEGLDELETVKSLAVILARLAEDDCEQGTPDSLPD